MVFSRAVFAWVALGASFGPLVMIRLCNRSIHPRAILASMLSGFVLAVTFYMLPSAPGDFLERVLPFFIATGIAFFGSKPTVRVK